MATASYLGPNDYNLVKEIRPFNLPYESTMQEIAIKQEYWKVGAERVKTEYDRAVGLDPQFVQNREYLKNFMNEANKNLQKINKSDLRVSDNSQQATNVFKPLYDISNPFNYRLLADSQINKHYQKQQQLSDTYRTKDGGKEWNQNNDFYFRDAQQKYLADAKAGNVASIDSHFQNKKSYIPYYDYKKEVLDLQEACKGYSFDRKDIARGNDLYFEQSSKKGCSPTELAQAFKSGLSDRARQQMQIDGYVHFKGNEDELVRQFTDISVNKAKQQVDGIKATIAGIKDGGVSKEEMPRLAFYENQLAELEPELKQSIEEFNTMTKGNTLDYVKQNYDRLAGQVYFGDLTSQMANAFRTDEEKNIVSTNPAGMLKLRLETDRTNMYIQNRMDNESDYLNHLYDKDEAAQKFEYDKELARLKGELKSNGSSSEMGIPLNVDPVTGRNIGITTVTESDFINSNLVPARDKATTTYNVVDDLVRKQLGKTDTKLTNDQIVNYVTELENKKNKGDIVSQEGENILQAYGRYKNAKDDLSFANDQLSAADAIARDKRKDLFDNSKFSDNIVLNNYSMKLGDGSITMYNPEPLSEKDVSRILNGEDVKGFSYENPTGSKLPTEAGIKYILYQGEPIVFDQNNTKLHDFFKSVVRKKQDDIAEINKLKTEFFTDQNYINSQMTVFNKMDFGKAQDFENQYGEKIKQFFSVTGGLNDKNGYTVVGRDKYGSGAYIKVLDEDGKPQKLNSATYAKLRGSDRGASITEDKNTQSYYIPDFFPRYGGLPNNQTLDKYNKVEQHMRNIEKSLQTNSQFNNAITMDTRQLSVGGTTRYVGDKFGIEYIISIYKEQGQPNMYVATYTVPGTNEERKYKEQTLDALLPQLQ